MVNKNIFDLFGLFIKYFILPNKFVYKYVRKCEYYFFFKSYFLYLRTYLKTFFLFKNYYVYIYIEIIIKNHYYFNINWLFFKSCIKKKFFDIDFFKIRVN